MFQQGKANVAAYTVSILSKYIGDRIDLDRIWQQQAASQRLQEQIQAWAREVQGRMAEGLAMKANY